MAFSKNAHDIFQITFPNHESDFKHFHAKEAIRKKGKAENNYQNVKTTDKINKKLKETERN